MRSVELIQAFAWTCDECGRDQFERAISIEPETIEASTVAQFTQATMTELGKLSDELGIEFGGGWIMAPDYVTCQHCKSKFKVEG